VVGFLERLVHAHPGGLDFAELFHGEGGEVDVYAPDFTVGGARVVDGADGVEDVAQTVRPGIGLAAHQQDALVALTDEDAGLGGDLRLGERAAPDLPVARVEGTVDALVVAVIGDVEGGEQHQARAVDFLLGPARGGEEFFTHGGIGAGYEDGCIAGTESAQLAGLGEHIAGGGRIAGGRVEGLADGGFIDDSSGGGHLGSSGSNLHL